MMRSKVNLAAIIAIAAMAMPGNHRRHVPIFANKQSDEDAFAAQQKAQHKRDRKAAKRPASAKGETP